MISESAGSSIAMSCIIKCIQNDLRLPDRLVTAYGVSAVDFSLSPSRFLSIIDPVLPFTLIFKFLMAYIADEKQKNKLMPLREYDLEVPDDHLISQIKASDEILMKFPSITFLCPSMDPCLDDA